MTAILEYLVTSYALLGICAAVAGALIFHHFTRGGYHISNDPDDPLDPRNHPD